MARHLKLRTLSALMAAALASLTTSAWVITSAQALANDSQSPPHPLSAWIAVPIGFTVFLLAIYACSRLIRRDYCAERQLRDESGDKTITPFPGDGGHFPFH